MAPIFRIQQEFNISDPELDKAIKDGINNMANTKNWTDNSLSEQQLKDILKIE